MILQFSHATEMFLNTTTSVLDAKDSVYSQQLQSTIFSSVWAVLLLYIIIALSFSLLKRRNTRNVNARNGVVFSTKVGSKVLEVLTLIATCALLGFMLVEIPLTQQQSRPFCKIYHRTTTILAIVVLGSVYFVLWFRVYVIFYRHPLIKTVTSKKIRFLSKLACVMWFLMVVINSYSFLSATAYATTKLGCIKVPDEKHTLVKWGLLVASTVIFQVTLLSLLVYPLVLHRRNMLHVGFDSSSVMPVIRRAFVTAAICVVSDALNVVYALVNEEPITYVRHTVYGCNLIINLVALICSRADWKEKVFPLCFICYKKSITKQPKCTVYHIPNVHAIEAYP